jgi:hypothetical protein
LFLYKLLKLLLLFFRPFPEDFPNPTIDSFGKSFRGLLDCCCDFLLASLGAADFLAVSLGSRPSFRADAV